VNIVRDKAFYKSLLAFAVPIALQNLISFGVNALDTVMLGSLSEVELSASSLANQWTMLFNLFVFGASGGSIALISQYWGKHDIPTIRRIMSMIFKIGLLAGAAFMAVGLLFPRTIIRIYTTDPAVIEAGVTYLRIVCLGYIPASLMSVGMFVLRSVEIVKIATYINVMTLVVNGCLNYLLIFGKFGFPRLGIAGAAIATVIARVCEAIVIIVYMTRFEKKIAFSFKDMLQPIDRGLFKDYIKVGIPVLFNEVLWSLATSMQSMIVGRISTNMVAAMSIVNVVTQLATLASWGVCSSSGVFVGKAIGRGDTEAAKQYAVTYELLSFIFGLIATVMVFLCSGFAIDFYQVTDETREIARQILYAAAVMMFFAPLSSTYIVGIFRGAGDTKFALWADNIFLWLVTLPFGILVGWVLQWPAWVVYVCLKLDAPLKVLICFFRARSGKWIRNVTREGEGITSYRQDVEAADAKND